MGRFITRSTVTSSNWEDVSVGMTQMPAQLATDGRKVRMDITGSDWGARVDVVNGASVTRVVGGAYDGTDCIRIVPPSGSTPNEHQTYSSIMTGLDLSISGTKDVAQANLGFCIRYGSRYWDLSHTAKVTGIQAATSVGGEPQAQGRAAIFENFKDLGGGDLRRVFCVTSMTTQAYKEPDNWIDQGPETDFLFVLGNTSNHANDPPLIATEWLYFEQEVDYRQNRGNANGRNRLDVWARGGYLGWLDIPLTWEATWSFTYAYARQIEYIGALWNSPATAHADNYLEVSHPIVAVNRAKDERIGPPTKQTRFVL
jgi:hypothetical protein